MTKKQLAEYCRSAETLMRLEAATTESAEKYDFLKREKRFKLLAKALEELVDLEADWCKEGESIEQRLQRERTENVQLMGQLAAEKKRGEALYDLLREYVIAGGGVANKGVSLNFLLEFVKEIAALKKLAYEGIEARNKKQPISAVEWLRKRADDLSSVSGPWVDCGPDGTAKAFRAEADRLEKEFNNAN